MKSRRCPKTESWLLKENGLHFEFALSKAIWYELWLLLMLIIIETTLWLFYLMKVHFLLILDKIKVYVNYVAK